MKVGTVNLKNKSVFRQSKKGDPLEASIKKSMPAEVPRPKNNDFNADSEQFDQEVKSLHKKKSLDPLTEKLGQKTFLYKATFQWLKYEVCGCFYRLEVERYYEELKLAIDLNLDAQEQKHVVLKRELCEKNGIQYFYVTCPEDLETMFKLLAAH